LAVCIREVQKSLMQSSKRMIESKIQSLGVGSAFKILHDRIITPGDGLIIFQGMQDATAEYIKSLEGFRIAWIKEAQTLSQLRPLLGTHVLQPEPAALLAAQLAAWRVRCRRGCRYRRTRVQGCKPFGFHHALHPLHAS
jgi:hypothetical protein